MVVLVEDAIKTVSSAGVDLGEVVVWIDDRLA
jgi:hypothetical protein